MNPPVAENYKRSVKAASSWGDTSEPIVTQLYSYFEIFCPAFQVSLCTPCRAAAGQCLLFDQ